MALLMSLVKLTIALYYRSDRLSPAHPLISCTMPNIIWTEPMEVLFLKLIISSGVHMASKGCSSGDLWLQVNKDLFLNDLFIPFKEEHYKEKDYRKLRDKFNAMKKEATKMMLGMVQEMRG